MAPIPAAPRTQRVCDRGSACEAPGGGRVPRAPRAGLVPHSPAAARVCQGGSPDSRSALLTIGNSF